MTGAGSGGDKREGLRTLGTLAMVSLVLAPLVLFCSFLFVVIGEDGLSSPQAPSSLVKVFLAFRHGSRAPSYETYQNDSYKKEDKRFWPAGAGELTKIGKQEAFELGEKLRERYKGFLGDYYVKDDFKAYSTIKDRTIMSAQLVAAALFPPKDYQLWRSALQWQPIPVFPDYVVNATDNIGCPWFLISSEAEMMKTPPSEFGFDEKDLSLLISHAGPFDKDPFTFMSKLWDIWDTLYYQEKEGLTLPDWTKTLYPDKMSAAVLKYVKFYLSGTSTRKMIITDPYGKGLANFFINDDKIMELHSWHDMNIIALMVLLGLEIDKHPEPTSCLAIELHNKTGDLYLEVYHFSNSKVTYPKLLKMPCGTSCLSSDLLKPFQSYGQKNFDKICSSKSPDIPFTVALD